MKTPKEKAPQTAVEWLIDIYLTTGIDRNVHFHQAKQMEREQHGNTWDAAIKAHDDRGHVYVRSICDFDDYEVGS